MVGQIVGRVWHFVARRRVRPEDMRRASDALSRLRRRYVFGAATREAYDAQMTAHRRPWRRGRGDRKVPPAK